MARPTARIQAEIDRIEALLSGDTTATGSAMAADASVAQTVSDASTSLTFADRAKLEARLEFLYRQLDRLSGRAPLFTRGRVVGLPGGSVRE